jgi:hypothetical protein
MLSSRHCFEIFEKSILAYHVHDDVDHSLDNPYETGSIENLLFRKNWIDTVQWHFEDIIRDPGIDPVEALQLKRRIDKSNQDRTDLVELIDNIILQEVKEIKPLPDATLNTETPAWAIDRLSILALKIYHMSVESGRTDVAAEQQENCRQKLTVLLEQKQDLFLSIDQLLDDIKTGKRKMKLYKQMKMYNDPALNPVLYKK